MNRGELWLISAEHIPLFIYLFILFVTLLFLRPPMAPKFPRNKCAGRPCARGLWLAHRRPAVDSEDRFQSAAAISSPIRERRLPTQRSRMLNTTLKHAFTVGRRPRNPPSRAAAEIPKKTKLETKHHILKRLKQTRPDQTDPDQTRPD